MQAAQNSYSRRRGMHHSFRKPQPEETTASTSIPTQLARLVAVTIHQLGPAITYKLYNFMHWCIVVECKGNWTFYVARPEQITLWHRFLAMTGYYEYPILSPADLEIWRDKHRSVFINGIIQLLEGFGYLVYTPLWLVRGTSRLIKRKLMSSTPVPSVPPLQHDPAPTEQRVITPFSYIPDNYPHCLKRKPSVKTSSTGIVGSKDSVGVSRRQKPQLVIAVSPSDLGSVQVARNFGLKARGQQSLVGISQHRSSMVPRTPLCKQGTQAPLEISTPKPGTTTPGPLANNLRSQGPMGTSLANPAQPGLRFRISDDRLRMTESHPFTNSSESITSASVPSSSKSTQRDPKSRPPIVGYVQVKKTAVFRLASDASNTSSTTMASATSTPVAESSSTSHSTFSTSFSVTSSSKSFLLRTTPNTPATSKSPVLFQSFAKVRTGSGTSVSFKESEPVHSSIFQGPGSFTPPSRTLWTYRFSDFPEPET